MSNKINVIEKHYRIAKEKYLELGIDTDNILKKLDCIPISINCWQGDDVRGFENPEGNLTGGIQATGNYLGRAKTPEQLRSDLEKAFLLIPGKKRLNLHAMYLETNGEKIDRDQIEPKHFKNWIMWAKEQKIGLDFNPTFFSHPKSNHGFTLSHPDKGIRDFWIEHLKRSRKISEYFGRELGTPSIMNIWVPDGMKDVTVDRLGPRQRLKDSLDEALSEKIDRKYHIDAVEGKVFGIGAEYYTVGSHEFYEGYAIENKLALCLDAGHYHPTERISDKISAISLFVKDILLHVSRPVRWDSDHVVILDDELIEIAKEIIGNDLIDRIHLGLDFFDASINRIAAWTIGTRNMFKALTIALLQPTDILKSSELEFNFSNRLSMIEELKSYPWEAVWDYYCYINDVPIGMDWIQEVKKYEKTVLMNR